MAQNHTPLPGLRDGPANVSPPNGNPSPQQQSASFSPSPEAAPVRVDLQSPSEHAQQHEELPIQEAVEHEVHDADVAQFVQTKKENVQLPAELTSHGLKAVTQTNFPAYQNVKIPITDDQVLDGEKQPLTASMRWLAEYAKFLLWQAHISIRRIGGRPVRVVRKS